MPPVLPAAGRLLVDAANVVGSRPDGWWRDRPGAARRLLARVRAAPALSSALLPAVVVLEGAARTAEEEGEQGGVRVVHAPGSGDDLLAALAGPGAVVVTADRELRARAEAAGARVVGPRWLLDQLPPDPPPATTPGSPSSC